MKKTLFVTFVALVCATSIFAAISVSGSATAGYTFNFDGDYEQKLEDAAVGEIGLGVETDYAGVSFDIVVPDGGNNDLGELDFQAGISLYVDKMLKDAGLEIPVDVTLYTGNTNKAVLYAYKDPAGRIDDDYGLKSKNVSSSANLPVFADVSYNDLVTVRAGVDFIGVDGAKGFSVSSLINPVSGLSVAFGVVNDGNAFNSGVVAPYALNLSSSVDIDKMVDMPFALNLSALTYIGMGEGFDQKDDLVFASVTAGYQDVEGYVEYSYNDYVAAGVDGAHRIEMGLGYNGIENLSLGTSFAFNNLADVSSSTIGYDISAEYTIGNVALGASFLDYNKKPGMEFYTTVSF